MPKTRRSAVMKKWQKLPGPQLIKIAKIHRSAITKKGSQNIPKCTRKKFCKFVKLTGKMPKTYRYEVMKKCQKLPGPRSRKMSKTFRSAVTKKIVQMPKTRRSTVMKKCHKLIGLRTQKIPKVHRSAVLEICQTDRKIALNSQVQVK